MTLYDLLQANASAEQLRALWLVFDSVFANSISEKQPQYQNQVAPVMLANGSFALCADLLTEKDGMYAPTFGQLDQELFSSVDVVTFDQISSLFSNTELL